MFLPQNMTESEKGLAAEVARGILAKEQPSTPEEERQAISWAEQVSAEMIWAARNPDPLYEDPEYQPRPEDPEILEAELDGEWEREYRQQVADRLHAEAVERGEITEDETWPPSEDLTFRWTELEIPPRPR